MKVVTGGIAHESNCFVPETMSTTLEKWRRGTTVYGHEKGQTPPEEWFERTQAAKDFGMLSAQIAFMEVAEEEGIELVPTIFGRCSILPGEGACWRPLDADLFEWAVGELIKGIKNAGEIDGVLLQGHGAGNSMGFPDMPGELQRRVRQAIGPDVPFVVTTDTHANFGKQMVDNVDVFVGYDTYPHTDGYARAREATHIIAQMIRGELKPTQALARPNMMPPLIPCQSALYPMKHLYDMIHEIEEEDSEVVTATVAGGFPTSDRPEMGIAVLVTTNDNPELAQKHADRISGWAWRHRREFLANVMSPEDAIREAIEAPEGPVVMGDPGDSTGCGGTGDGTALLAELIKQEAKNALVAGIRDPEAVDKAIKTGVGKTVTMKIGGKIDKLHGEPVEVKGYVKQITDGKHVGPAMGGGLSVSNWGKTVVLDCKGVEIILTELPCGPTSFPYPSMGIEADKKKIVCIKSAAHYKAVWKPHAKQFIDPDTPGPGCGSRIGGLNWKHLKRPIFPLDVELLGIAELQKGVYKDITVDSCYL